MNKYELWLENCTKQPNIQLCLLEGTPPYKLFKLIELDTKLKSSNNSNYYIPNYHVWNIEIGDWFVSNNYLTTYSKYRKGLDQ